MTTALAESIDVALPGDDREGRGRHSPERGCPERRCIVRGTSTDRSGLVRFVVGPDGEVVPDVDERLPGRGLWLTADAETIRLALRRNAFARAARRQVRIAPDLAARLERLLLRRSIDAIGLALRAGRAVFGYEKVRERLLGGASGVLVEAADGAPSDRAKLRALAGGAPIVVDALTADELGRALGRERTVHGLVAHGALADRLVRDASRLGGVRRPAEGRPQDHST